MPTLSWLGKKKIVNHHLDVPFHVLDRKYKFESTVKNENNSSGNRIIHGDNLAILKSLLPEFEGKVDCIYIDPPYNTGNEKWVYNDNVNDPRINKWLHTVVGKEGDDLSRHDKWLCMMYPRLQLFKKLLADDGKLVISIGHHELFNLYPILQELFSNKQIVCTTIQTSGGKPSGSFNFVHEFLVFVLPNDFDANPMSFTGGKDRSPFEGLTLSTFDKTQRPNQTYPIFIDIESMNIVGVGKSLQARVKENLYDGELKNFEYNFDEATSGTVAIWPITSKGKDCVWRLTSERLLADWKLGYIKVSINKNKKSKNKFSIQYLPEGVIKKIEKGILKTEGTEENSPTLVFGENKTEGNSLPTLWLEKEFFTVSGTSLLNDIFNQKIFDYPKPLFLITEVLKALTSEDDIILDSFAGSGTTAHAVLKLNSEDDRNRRFILCEMMDYAETLTAERVRRVMDGYSEGENKIEGLGGSFEFFELGEPLFLENDLLNESVGIERIRQYVSYSERIPLEQQLPIENNITPSALGVNEQTLWLFNYDENAVTSLDLDFLGSLNLRELKQRPSQYVIYADKCVLETKFMQDHGITFKRIPRDILRF